MRSPSEHIKLLQRRVDFLKSREHQNSYDLAEIGSLEWALANLPTKQKQLCRDDGRCQYAIDSGAEGMGHCPEGKCVMPAKQEQDEPVAEVEADGVMRFKPTSRKYKVGDRVYLHPQPKREPLTDEQVDDLHGEANRGFCIEREDYFKAFRDAEAAHGIKGKA